MTTVPPRTTWTDEGHWRYHVATGTFADDCHHCWAAQHGRALNREEQARRDEIARIREEERAARVMLTLAGAVIVAFIGLVVAVTSPVPLNGRHLLGVVIFALAAAAILRVLVINGRRAER